MPFIDILTVQLFVLGFMGLTVAYVTLHAALLYRRRKRHGSALRSAAIPLALLGFYALVSGLFGQFIWPLPSAYNILFYDIYPLVGLLFIGFAWSLNSKLNLQYTGFFALLLGLMSIFYGVQGYAAGLTKTPSALLGLYLFFGISGILGYPVTLMLDRAEAGEKNRWIGWMVIITVFIIFLMLSSLLSIYVGISAVPAHLTSPP